MTTIPWQRDARTLDGDISLDGRGVEVMVGDGLISFEEELSLVGSSIVRIGVVDPQRVMIDSGLLARDADDEDRLERNVELELDGVVYWLRSVAKRDDRFMLTFEDRTVSRMRERGEVKLANPTWTDHRAFVRRLCELAGVDGPQFEEPGAAERRASDTLKGTSRGKRDSQLADADDRRAEGIDSDERLRVRSAWATSAQLDVATQLLTVARRLGASDKAMRALVAAAIEATGLRNEARAGDSGGLGVLRAVPGRSRCHAGRFTKQRATDAEFSAEAFLRDPGFAGQGGAMRTDRQRADRTIGEIAHVVRRAANARAYDRWERQARAIVEAFRSDEDEDDDYRRRDQTLSVIRGETYWDAAVRIGGLNDCVFFVAANRAYYLPERTLRTSRARLRIGEQTPGVHTIDWEWAPHKRLKRVELIGEIYEQMTPGTIVVLDDDCGPAAGRWLVAEYRRSRYSNTAVVTLVRPRRRKRRGSR